MIIGFYDDTKCNNPSISTKYDRLGPENSFWARKFEPDEIETQLSTPLSYVPLPCTPDCLAPIRLDARHSLSLTFIRTERDRETVICW